MSYIAMLSGSPSIQSRTSHLLATAERMLQSQGLLAHRIDIRALPAGALVHADSADPAIAHAREIVRQACAVIIATPIYNASYSGVLKTFLDLLPRDAFSFKPVLSLAAGGSQGHMLALDYALKPVLCALGARHQLANVFAADSDIPKVDGQYRLEPDVASRLRSAVTALVATLGANDTRPLSPGDAIDYDTTEPAAALIR
ncbi:NADPH-dependent FMN reductase [Trinickia acidisoli]|uniref:NADPH-dependent FMN reductase n=1 Tax=Trinickia acidisoli TaxID=2767482 RepID=UPI001A8E07B7|nr:NADPH-dependent FMN reductase [Trinickia acidisoli]